MDKRRMIRINDEIMNELNKIFRDGIKDPRMTAMASVLRVETTPDLKFCKVFVSIMGDDEAKQKGMEAIESAKGHIRSNIAHSINLRQTPEFTFILDDSLDHGFKIGEILDNVNQ
ncbi:MAG: 30S ribosome-binding factor RbfA [Clostridiales bacterium]|jgi:ribosome-binding factor A|nr:30S ribosome-binding factor RbfA [Clostridiales bacterium]